ncbi:BTB domain-containing protein [Caenorhabditis elegans]|uniref:BTB domain-containing protein n=1 Tax=Caenorhabditis elegans TaxID=6239 RepID=O45084_CAEEL|nr:BTB domain-containing protein [Caenorhabditis elegans]CCD65001.2 BTB domain-containing protein [Caenorhabditis elegans]|eukprot:NP_501042.2 Uncharacterized protein CELE_C17H12.12 [Caenorhabditis elegans]
MTTIDDLRNPKVYTVQELTETIKRYDIQRIRGDFSQCNITLKFSSGAEIKVHSLILQTFSKKFHDLRDGIIITRTVNMEPFDEGVVRDVIYWMYTGKLFLMDVPHYNLAEFWDMPELLVQITDELKNDVDLTFRFINTSSTNIKDRPQAALRPHCTIEHDVTNVTILCVNLIADYESSPKLTMVQLMRLSTCSIYACMAVRMPLKKKIPLIFMVCDWLIEKKPRLDTVIGIIQSLVFDRYTSHVFVERIRQHAYMFVTDLHQSFKFMIFFNGATRIDRDETKEYHPDPLDLRVFNNDPNISRPNENPYKPRYSNDDWSFETGNQVELKKFRDFFDEEYERKLKAHQQKPPVPKPAIEVTWDASNFGKPPSESVKNCVLEERPKTPERPKFTLGITHLESDIRVEDRLMFRVRALNNPRHYAMAVEREVEAQKIKKMEMDQLYGDYEKSNYVGHQNNPQPDVNRSQYCYTSRSVHHPADQYQHLDKRQRNLSYSAPPKNYVILSPHSNNNRRSVDSQNSNQSFDGLSANSQNYYDQQFAGRYTHNPDTAGPSSSNSVYNRNMRDDGTSGANGNAEAGPSTSYASGGSSKKQPRETGSGSKISHYLYPK